MPAFLIPLLIQAGGALFGGVAAGSGVLVTHGSWTQVLSAFIGGLGGGAVLHALPSSIPGAQPTQGQG